MKALIQLTVVVAIGILYMIWAEMAPNRKRLIGFYDRANGE